MVHMEEMIILQLYEWKWQTYNKWFASMQLKLQFCSSFLLLCAVRSIIILLRQRNIFVKAAFVGGAGADDDCVHCGHFQCIYFAWLYYFPQNVLFLLYLDLSMFVVVGWTKHTSSTILWIHYFHLFAFFLFRSSHYISLIFSPVYLSSP